MRPSMKCALVLLTSGIMSYVATPVLADDHATEWPATRNSAAARDASLHHIDKPVLVLAQTTRPQETLQGVVTAIDERSDRISLRLVSNDNSEFRIQDGLIFNAIHNGDRVEITVENIGGVKTIVALKKL